MGLWLVGGVNACRDYRLLGVKIYRDYGLLRVKVYRDYDFSGF